MGPRSVRRRATDSTGSVGRVALRLVAQQDHAPRLLDVGRFRDREADRAIDRRLHLAECGARRIGDRDEDAAIGEEPDRDRREALPDVRVHAGRRAEVHGDALDVDVAEPCLRRQAAREILREQPATLDQDLTEPLTGAGLLTQCVVQLLRLEQLALQQDRAQMGPLLLTEVGVVETR